MKRDPSRKCLCRKALSFVNVARENPVLVSIVVIHRKYRLKDICIITLSIWYSLAFQ